MQLTHLLTVYLLMVDLLMADLLAVDLLVVDLLVVDDLLRAAFPQQEDQVLRGVEETTQELLLYSPETVCCTS